jgi:hypothetical protein
MSYESIILDEMNHGGLPLAYWPLSEATGAVANDLMAAYNGAITGAVTLDSRPGPINRGNGCMSFGGTDGIVTIASDPIGAGAVTIEAWIHPTGWGESSQGRILETGTGAIRFIVISTNERMAIARSSTTVYSANNSIVLNEWRHVAVTSTAAGVTNFYVNGALSGTADQASGAPNAGTYMGIGNRADTARAFAGKIAHVAVYNYIVGVDRLRVHTLAAKSLAFVSQGGVAKILGVKAA